MISFFLKTKGPKSPATISLAFSQENTVEEAVRVLNQKSQEKGWDTIYELSTKQEYEAERSRIRIAQMNRKSLT